MSDPSKSKLSPTAAVLGTPPPPAATPTTIALDASAAPRPRSELQELLGLQPGIEAKLLSSRWGLRVPGVARAMSRGTGRGMPQAEGNGATANNDGAAAGAGMIEVAVWSRAASG